MPAIGYDSAMKKQIAIVEDEPALRENYSAALARHGYSVKTYGNRKNAMLAFQAHLPDLAIIDISLEDEAEGGFDLCRDLRALSAELPFNFLTARDSELDAVSGLRLGADELFTKDVNLSDRARIGEQSGACKEPPAVDGCRPCRPGRQHHHLPHQAHAPQVPADRSGVRCHPDRVRNGIPLGRVSIRLQLLIAALATLVLPWAGCQYARELETALRDSQEKSLLASAGTMANALSAQPQRIFPDSADTKSFAASRGDMYVYPLPGQPLLDGYRDDWGIGANPAALASSTGYRARVQAGSTERYLYLFI